MGEQLVLPIALQASPSPGDGRQTFRVGGRTLVAGECFDAYWLFAAERMRIFHKRAAGVPGPWTDDPVLARHKFTNVYRAADRVSQYLIREVIYAGPQDPGEVVFRVLLFKFFNRVETWELLCERLGRLPSWEGYRFAAYDRVLGDAMSRGERVYSAAHIVPNPAFGEARKHGNHLRLTEHAMTAGLPGKVAEAAGLREVYELLRGLPSLGPFLAYQYAVDLAYSAVTRADESQFVVAGPGALDGISKCFAEWPAPVDWQNVFCETSKYTRATHPHVRGVPGRTRIKQEFRQAPARIDYRFPPKWGLPAERTAQVRPGRGR